MNNTQSENKDRLSPQIEPSSEPILEINGLKKHFVQNDGFLDKLLNNHEVVHAVDGVDITLHRGETVAVVGESGCGKTTFGHTVLNLHDATEGSVMYDGVDLTELSDSQIRSYRQELQLIFQDPLASLNPRKTVGKTLKAAMSAHNIHGNSDERTKYAKELLVRVGLSESHFDRYPHQFSGGQQQRIAIARALSLDPSIIVADEPVSALDVSVQAQILNLIKDLQKEFDLSMLYISHDLSTVKFLADRVAVMYLGKIVEMAPTDEIFEDPKHPYTKALISAVPRLTRDQNRSRIMLRGSVPSPISPPDGCRFHTRCPEVIPPADWLGSQEEYQDALTLALKIKNNTIDPDSTRITLEAENKSSTDDDVVERVLEEGLRDSYESLDQSYVQLLREGVHAQIANEDIAMIKQFLDTPCIKRVPSEIPVTDRQVALCHLYDE